MTCGANEKASRTSLLSETGLPRRHWVHRDQRGTPHPRGICMDVKRRELREKGFVRVCVATEFSWSLSPTYCDRQNTGTRYMAARTSCHTDSCTPRRSGQASMKTKDEPIGLA